MKLGCIARGSMTFSLDRLHGAQQQGKQLALVPFPLRKMVQEGRQKPFFLLQRAILPSKGIMQNINIDNTQRGRESYISSGKSQIIAFNQVALWSFKSPCFSSLAFHESSFSFPKQELHFDSMSFLSLSFEAFATKWFIYFCWEQHFCWILRRLESWLSNCSLSLLPGTSWNQISSSYGGRRSAELSLFSAPLIFGPLLSGPHMI